LAEKIAENCNLPNQPDPCLVSRPATCCL
jgi:hypothetical protein